MISQEAKQRMHAAVARYPVARSAMLPALHIVQEEEGFITEEGINAVAEVIGAKPDEVQSIATFYSMYFKKPAGQYVIKVCTSISCYLRGCDQLLEHLEKRLGIPRGQTTPDGQFTLLTTECLASCGTAPVLQVNNEFVEDLTTDKVDALIAELRRQPATTAQEC
jgi:NADH-quinone oxidoreductase E subunit